MSRKKAPASRVIKLLPYDRVATAVEHGTTGGVAKALKYWDGKSVDTLEELLDKYVGLYMMNELCELIDFES